MSIRWGDLGAVLVAALGATVLVVLLFSLGVAAWSRAAEAARPSPGPRIAAVLCFAACLAVAGYAIDVIVPS